MGDAVLSAFLSFGVVNQEPRAFAYGSSGTDIHNYLRTKAIGLGAIVFALNGIEDHVHIVVSIPPRIAVATFVGQVKAVASTKFNKSPGDHPSFFWQEEYGAFSFDGKRLPNYIAYVERQKEHHANQRTIPILERTTGDGVQLIREDEAGYAFEDDIWRSEMERLALGCRVMKSPAEWDRPRTPGDEVTRLSNSARSIGLDRIPNPLEWVLLHSPADLSPGGRGRQT